MSSKLAVAAATLVAAACARERASLSVSAQTSTPASSTTSATPTASGPLDLGNGITVDQIRISFTAVALDDDDDHRHCRHTGGTGGGGGDDRGHDDDDDDDDGKCEHHFGAVTAELPAGNLEQPVELARNTVRPRTFQHVVLSLGPATAGAGSSPAVADMAARQASLVVEGTVDGKPFSFVSGIVATIDVVSEVVVSAGAQNNVTVSVDPSAWFGGTGASRLDPTLASNQAAIEGNVEGSITAFEDDDHDNEHHHRSGSGGHGD